MTRRITNVMKGIIRIITTWHPRGIHSAFLLFPLCLSQSAWAQAQHPSASGDSMVFESGAAARVVEKVRCGTQGVIVEILVKPGDTVVKGQILGHTDLDATKLQLDIAKSTLDARGNVEAARGQAEAWTVTRRETEEAIRRRKAEKTRLEWASAMEDMYRGTYEVQLDAEKTQLIQYEYWKDQYEKRFLRAPVDGVVSEVMVEPGKSVNIASHAFTIRNDNVFSIPVKIPADVARVPESGEMLPVCPSGSKSATHARVDSVVDNPDKSGGKTARLLVPITDFPAAIRAKLIGMKFDVLMPMLTRNDTKGHDVSRR